MRQNRGLFIIVIVSVIGAAALAIFLAILLTRSGTDSDELLKEAGKAALQVLTVAVLGTVLKLLVDHYKGEQERLARDARFRQDKYDRLVEATNTLRRVPFLIKADRSVETFDDQLRQVIESGLKLRMIKHQIWSSKGVPDPPFPDYQRLTYLFESLYHYTDWVIEDFVRAKEPLLDARRRAEDPDLAPEARRRAAKQVRLWVPELYAVDDMLATKDRKAHEDCQAQVECKLKEALSESEQESESEERSKSKIDWLPEPEGPWSWLRYEETEKLAFASITEATLEHRGSHGRDGLGDFSGFKRMLQPQRAPRTSKETGKEPTRSL